MSPVFEASGRVQRSFIECLVVIGQICCWALLCRHVEKGFLGILSCSSVHHGCQMAIVRFGDRMAPLRFAAKLDPFLSLDCARVEGVGAQSKERKGSNFAIWQP